MACFPLFGFSNAKIPKDVEAVLQKAGKNKSELLKAINYFQRAGDPLKLQAAYFLISNIDIHYSQDVYWVTPKGKRIMFNELAYKDYAASQTALEALKKKYKIHSKVVVIKDIEVIKGKYLIENIEQAFTVRNSTISKDVSFRDFCEYVLPYRVSTEPLSNWRKTYMQRFAFIRQKPTDRGSKAIATDFFADFKFWFSNTFGSEVREDFPRLGAFQLLFRKKGPCEDISDLLGLSLRSQGLPTALDEVTYWATSSGRHYFNVLFDKSMKPYPIYDASTKIFSNSPFEREPAKVIRRTFSKQKNVIANFLPSDQIPPGFMRNKNFLDVTDSYWKVRDLNCGLFRRVEGPPKYVFISTFNTLKWNPTWWAKLKGDSVVFKSMSQGAVYLPQYYVAGKLESAGFPIVSGYQRQVVLKPDLKVKRIITVYPKEKYLVFRRNSHYILHYWNKGWVILQTAFVEDPLIKCLTFKDVPANCLFLLLPERSENKERPFTISSDGTQQWW